MPGAKYFREQAQLLLAWALATTDPDYATLLTTRAMELLAKSTQRHGDPAFRLTDALDEFNDQQLRGRPRLQQQEARRGNED